MVQGWLRLGTIEMEYDRYWQYELRLLRDCNISSGSFASPDWTGIYT